MAAVPQNTSSQTGSETLQLSQQPEAAKPTDKTGKSVGRLDAPEKELRQKPGTKMFTFQDIPRRPQMVLRLTLKEKSYWEKFVDTVRSLPTAREFLASLQSEKNKILAKVKKGKSISQDEIDFLNKAMTEEIDGVFDNFKQQTKEVLRIEPEDDPQTIVFKVTLTQNLLKWLDALFEWMMKKIGDILAMVDQHGADWCVKKAKDLFDFMLSKMAEDD